MERRNAFNCEFQKIRVFAYISKTNIFLETLISETVLQSGWIDRPEMFMRP